MNKYLPSTMMEKIMNRADRRSLDRRVDRLVDHLDDASARRELVQLSREIGQKIMYHDTVEDGTFLAFCATSNSLRCGMKDRNGCTCWEFGADGKLLRYWEGISGR